MKTASMLAKYSPGYPGANAVARSWFDVTSIRLFDIFFSGAGLLCTAPLFLIIAAAIYAHDRRPVFFFQERLGQGRKPFRIIKFRTMTWSACGNRAGAWATDEDPRVTGVGKVLRRYHLDELPQLVNVLLGSMSLVGPRPFRASVHAAIVEIEPRWDLRLEYKPGLTGFAQVSVDKGSTLEGHAAKIDQDLEMKNLTLASYFKILFRTPFKVIAGTSH